MRRDGGMAPHTAAARPGTRISPSALLLLLVVTLSNRCSGILTDETNHAGNPIELAVRLDGTGGLMAQRLQQQTSDVSTADVVRATYFKQYEATGWDRLEISVVEDCPASDEVKAKAAGYAEGFLQADRIYTYWTNYRRNEFKNTARQPSAELLAWMDQQDKFVRDSVVAAAVRAQAGSTREGEGGGGAGQRGGDEDSEYWVRMGLVMQQFDGLCEGVWAAAQPGQNLTYHELYVMQSVGDLYDLTVLFPQHGGLAGEEGKEVQREYRPGHGVVGPGGYGAGELLECSAFIKLGKPSSAGRATPLQARRRLAQGVPGTQRGGRPEDPQELLQLPGSSGTSRDFWAGHTTWRPFYAMLRTWKVYRLPWSKSGPLSVSSSPGFVGYSKDDWYTTGRFVIMETTNGMYNKDLYDSITPSCALMWQRVQVANLGAGSGEEWTELFQAHNSGTYNNQWMVLDVDALSAGSAAGVLWILEQLPATVEAADLSAVLLKQGFWPSFNVPYFERIYNMSGYPSDQDIHRTCPRAQIFAREHSSVEGLDAFMRLMRLNRYQHDPLSYGNPTNVVAARYDLEPLGPAAQNWTCRAHGAVDAKVVDRAAFRGGQTYAINGPSNEDQPTFSWSSFCDSGAASSSPAHTASKHMCDVSHDGLVDSFDFSWQLMGPA
mmetsp:Transcript_13709/g.38800  ORF Transcript_13709/g.38800 Transcript_13709/m.38800 type:complete len:662 (+) Transcript_13709:123-2108(+)